MCGLPVDAAQSGGVKCSLGAGLAGGREKDL